MELPYDKTRDVNLTLLITHSLPSPTSGETPIASIGYGDINVEPITGSTTETVNEPVVDENGDPVLGSDGN